MITGKPGRRHLAKAAIRSWINQSYPNTELVIINDGTPLVPDGGICESDLQSETEANEWGTVPCHIKEYGQGPGKSLGELRNIGLEITKGEYVIQWDDDDWYGPERISQQVNAAAKGHCVLLKKQIRYSFLNDSAFVMDWKFPATPAIPGTILHENKPGLSYPSQGKKEDEVFVQKHFDGRCVVLDNNPSLYVRFFHGGNTWDHTHVMGKYARPEMKGVWSLPGRARRDLQKLLDEHYSSGLVRR